VLARKFRATRLALDLDMPAIPDLIEPLCEGRVALRLGSERDIPEILIAHQDDPQLHERLGELRPPSGAELGRLAEQEAADRATGRRVTLTILQDESDDCRGQIYVHQFDWDHERAELGIWVVPALRGTGLARGALRLAGRWLLGPCGLQRLQIVTESDNDAMIRAARAAGFLDEGILRAYVREPPEDPRSARPGGAGRRGRAEREQRVDVAVLSLLPGDPQT
jgi:RimJ/RimL family protein N-acetyltransferase